MIEKSKLFERYNLAGTILANRIVMAPLTRRRAENQELAANELIAEYYRQRATAGLLISEGSQISPQGYGYSGSPGCYSQTQIDGWKIVTKAVHEAGGKIFHQLWHVGPFSHRLLQPTGGLPLSASAVQPSGEVLTPEGRLPYEVPMAMTVDQIYQTIRDFGQAAQNAMTAGFDGVEIHGAHAYIIDQFIMDSTNRRADEFGGNVANRSKFLFFVIEEILKYLPSEKVGLRLSPEGYRPGLFDSAARKTFSYIIQKLNDYHLAYLHLSEQMSPEDRIKNPGKSFVSYYRDLHRGTLLSCGGHSGESAQRMLEEGHADLIVFGRPFISNPDLVERLRTNAPLTSPDKATFYHGGATGYTDYPALNQD
ncbi:MAG: alkene reductase [Clostridia bacterium]|nr:alkene reductase [Clostridia bacterium]